MRTAIVIAVLVGGLLAGCRGETSMSTPIVPLRNMFDQDRIDPQQQSRFFRDGRGMRTPVEGTVEREQDLDPAVGQGRLVDDSGYVLEIPDAVVRKGGGMGALVERGHDRYDIYCRPCHDGLGAGQGTVAKRGLAPPPPSYHTDQLRHIPDGQLFATISNGVRNMPAYGYAIPVQDRWAIVSYVRALQLAEGE